ncbi:MAG: hypothetical protein WA004_17995 [Saprospiraceae bacterium]
MSFMRFFKTPGHLRYEYKPRFWDPEKEELKERIDRAAGEQKGDADSMKTRISEHFARRYTRGSAGSDYRRAQEKQSNFRLLIILAIILLLGYFFLIALPDFIQYFE